MTIAPGKFADSPEVDALSDILQTVRLRGEAVVRCAPPAPFHIAIPAGLRVVHIAESSGLYVHVPGGDGPIELATGDLVLLARGDRHSIATVDGPRRPRPLAATDRVAAGAHDARWVTGSFAVEHDVADPLLAVLPPAVVLRAAQPGREWLPLSLRLLLVEVTDPHPGAAVMISRILDLLFVHALRAWSGSNDAAPGWLTAAMDAQLAPVLTAIHRAPEHPWTVAELADRAQQSRSAFAQRFTRLLGQSPAAYVADRRLDRAADLLRSTPAPINHIARTVGYTSDAAFTRAFQRRYGDAPLRWRKATS